MKPPPFEYARAATADDALTLLDEAGEDAKLIAGGQSLTPLMAYRLARPSHLIDVNHIAGHQYIRQTEDGLAIGALTRHTTLEHATQLTGAWQALREAAAVIGHHPIRVRGTFGGSLAHADPAAELPVVAAALDAHFRIRSLSGEREAAPEDFFLGPFMTSLEPDEMLVEICFPAPPPGRRTVFEEFNTHSGDFALASVAVALALNDDGRAADVHRTRRRGADTDPTTGSGGRTDRRALTSRILSSVSGLCAAACAPAEDQRTSAAFRRELVEVLVGRALLRLTETS